MLPLGALVGAVAAGHGADRYGRRWAVALAAFAFAAGWYTLAAGNIDFGRLLTGVGCGASTLVGPVYIGEVAPTKWRGMCGAGFQLVLTLGILAVYSAGAGDKGAHTLLWRRLAVGGAVLPTFLLAGVLILPETPRFLTMVGRDAEAARALQLLHGGAPGSRRIVTEAQEQARAASAAPSSAPTDVFRRLVHAWRPLCIGIGLSFAQQLTGINAVVFFSSEILVEAGVGHNANGVAVGVAFVQLVSTLVGVLLVERLGRKPLLFASSMLMASSCFAIAIGARAGGTDGANLIAASLMLYMVGFSTGMGPVPWLMISEILPQDVRGAGAGLVGALNWLSGMACAATFPPLFAHSPPMTFGLYGGVCICAAIFVHRAVPETKGRTLESLEVEMATR